MDNNDNREEKFEKIKELKVLVIGVGGVGGYVVESLARCGVGSFILVDFDTVDITNINRQIIANLKTVGKYKVDLFKERIKEINEECKVITIKEKLTETNIDEILKYEPNFIVDACDDINAKKLLIKTYDKLKIPFISSMGTGKRLDPSLLEITTLDKTNYDPLAKILRKYTRDEKIKSKITVLASKETPIKTEDNIIASCSFVPSAAGLLIASYVIKTINN